MRTVPPFAVAFLNRKGGVGKTSCVKHAGGAFARAGKRVLVIDMDPQASLTQGFLGPDVALRLPDDRTVAAVFDDRLGASPHDIVRPTEFDNLHLAPCSAALNAFNLPDPRTYASVQGALREFVEEVRPRFDVILIDCPPNLNLCSWSALLAAGHCVVPFQPEDYGSQGVVHVHQLVQQARDRHNPRLRLMGHLLTMVRPRLAIHAEFERTLRELYGDAVFRTVIPDLSDYKVAITMRQPVGYYKPRSKAAKTFHALAEEMIDRADEAVAAPAVAESASPQEAIP